MSNMGFLEFAMRSAGMTVYGVFDRPRVKRRAFYLGGVRDGVSVEGGPFPLEAQIEEHCAEMLAWARENGGKLKLRRVLAPSFVVGRGQPRSGMTVAALTFDRQEAATEFQARWA